MIAGVSGHLVPEDFLEIHLTESAVDPAWAAWQRELVAWRRQTVALGPASPLRTLLEAAARPLATALGFRNPADTVVAETHALVLLRGEHATIVLLVAPWATPLAAQWRNAVVFAGLYGAAWCLLFNGTHIRLVAAARLFS